VIFPWCLGKRYRLKGEILKVREAPEPSDLIFENVYITKFTRIWRKCLAYFLGALAVLIGIGVLVTLKITHSNKDLAAWMDFSIYTYTTLIIATTVIIYLITDFLLEGIVINRSKTSFELCKVKFRLHISYLNINAYLVILMYFMVDFSMMQDQLWLTAIILAIIIPLRKVFSTISIRKILLRRRLYRDPHSLAKYSKKEIIEIFTKSQYDFANNLEDTVCFMFLALGFYFIGQLYMIITTMIGLIISICVDKLVMVHLTSPTKIRGSEMGLEFFRVLRWDLRLQLLTIAFVPTRIFPTEVPVSIRILLWVVYGIFMVWEFRSNPRKTWKRQWSKEREETKYVDVAKHFQHTYKEEYPFKIY